MTIISIIMRKCQPIKTILITIIIFTNSHTESNITWTAVKTPMRLPCQINTDQQNINIPFCLKKNLPKHHLYKQESSVMQ